MSQHSHGQGKMTSVAAEAVALASQLERLAARASAQEQRHPDMPVEHATVSVSTDIDAFLIQEHEEVLTELASLGELEEQLAALHAAELSMEELSVQELQMEMMQAEEAAVSEASLAELQAASAFECDARTKAEAAATSATRELTDELESLSLGAKAEAKAEAEQVEQLERELEVLEHRARQGTEEVAVLGFASGQATHYQNELAEARMEADETEARADLLEEACVRLREEVESMRYYLKDRKGYNHKRTQELNSQIQRLERQCKKLKAEQAEREEKARGSAVDVGQLSKLNALNERLALQLEEVAQDGAEKQQVTDQEQKELQNQRRELELHMEQMRRSETEVEEIEMMRYHLTKKEGPRLKTRIAYLKRQDERLEQDVEQMVLHLQEAEATLQRVQEEEASAEKRMELLEFSLRVLSAEPGKAKPSRRLRQRSSREAFPTQAARLEEFATSDSAAGGGATGDEASNQSSPRQG
mmetsp:Transcript_51550/g.116178  ORF Transcript_51550/g.116178 Transcript_51550/m.116178 type:complete len:475 (+) Transcript_51550:139-1563(+)